MNSSPPKIQKVALLIDTSMSWGVRLIRGIHEFAQQEAHWLFQIEPYGRHERLSMPVGWTGDGVIARVNHPELAKEISNGNVPAVNVSWYDYPGTNIARCTVSESETGVMAGQYFLTCGFTNFAYCGALDRPGYEDRLELGFRQSLEGHPHSFHRFEPAAPPTAKAPWDQRLASLVDWLSGLPKPIAVLCWCAARGRQVTEACHYANIRVPDEVAVLGGEYDELMEDISNPPLSTVEQPAERVGFEAAQLLSRMMKGESSPTEPIFISPTRVNVRHSTDILAVDDTLVRHAVEYITKFATAGIRVGDVVNELLVSRRSLEQRFMQSIHRTPAEEIRRVRIEEAKRLLMDTNLKMAGIAEKCGFGHQDRFSRMFRRAVGHTPSEYRRMYRAGE